MEFIQLYADVDDGDVAMSDGEDQDAGTQEDNNFIDNSIISADENFYRAFENVDRNSDEPVVDHLDWLLDNRDSQPENCTAFDTKEIEFDEFENVKNRIEKFNSV